MFKGFFCDHMQRFSKDNVIRWAYGGGGAAPCDPQGDFMNSNRAFLIHNVGFSVEKEYV